MQRQLFKDGKKRLAIHFGEPLRCLAIDDIHEL